MYNFNVLKTKCQTLFKLLLIGSVMLSTSYTSSYAEQPKKNTSKALSQFEERITLLEKELKNIKDKNYKLELSQEKANKNDNFLHKKNSEWKLSFGGRVFNDWAIPMAYGEVKNANGPFRNDAEFRKARLVMKGKSPKDFNFKFEINFSDGDADLTDVYLGLPVEKNTQLVIGQQKENFSMENKGSSAYTPFMERSPVSEVLSPKRNLGFSIEHLPKAPKPGYWLGFYRDSTGSGISNYGGGYTFTGRYTIQPIYKENGKHLLHLGIAGSHRTFGSSQPNYKLKTGAHLMPALGATGALNAKDADLFGFQTLIIDKSLGFASEVTQSKVSLRSGKEADFEGGYAQVFWYLTGETQEFDLSRRALGKVIPKKEFSNWRGGAWMLGVRYDYLDLIDSNASVNGGKLNEVTIGLNWIMSQDLRFMLNWVKANNAEHGAAETLQSRFQVTF
jgi:phosphate-selective porin OprO/OprP